MWCIWMTLSICTVCLHTDTITCVCGVYEWPYLYVLYVSIQIPLHVYVVYMNDPIYMYCMSPYRYYYMCMWCIWMTLSICTVCMSPYRYYYMCMWCIWMTLSICTVCMSPIQIPLHVYVVYMNDPIYMYCMSPYRYYYMCMWCIWMTLSICTVCLHTDTITCVCGVYEWPYLYVLYVSIQIPLHVYVVYMNDPIYMYCMSPYRYHYMCMWCIWMTLSICTVCLHTDTITCVCGVYEWPYLYVLYVSIQILLHVYVVYMSDPIYMYCMSPYRYYYMCMWCIWMTLSICTVCMSPIQIPLHVYVVYMNDPIYMYCMSPYRYYYMCMWCIWMTLSICTVCMSPIQILLHVYVVYMNDPIYMYCMSPIQIPLHVYVVYMNDPIYMYCMSPYRYHYMCMWCIWMTLSICTVCLHTDTITCVCGVYEWPYLYVLYVSIQIPLHVYVVYMNDPYLYVLYVPHTDTITCVCGVYEWPYLYVLYVSIQIPLHVYVVYMNDPIYMYCMSPYIYHYMCMWCIWMTLSICTVCLHTDTITCVCGVYEWPYLYVLYVSIQILLQCEAIATLHKGSTPLIVMTTQIITRLVALPTRVCSSCVLPTNIIVWCDTGFGTVDCVLTALYGTWWGLCRLVSTPDWHWCPCTRLQHSGRWRGSRVRGMLLHTRPLLLSPSSSSVCVAGLLLTALVDATLS